MQEQVFTLAYPTPDEDGNDKTNQDDWMCTLLKLLPWANELIS